VFTGGDGLRVPVDVGDAIVNSVVFAVLAAVVAVPLGVALARAAVSSSSRAADFVASLPLGSSAVVVGLGIIVTYDTGVFDVRGEWWLVPLVHAAVALPFVVRAIVPMVEAIPPGLAQAAATLGAAPWRRWFDIDLPLLRPAVATASAFSLTMSIGEFGATSFLTRRDTTTLPIVVDTLLGRAGSLPHMTAFAVASVLLVVTVLTVTAVDRSVRT
jgi:thiamine transport system permease protein